MEELSKNMQPQPSAFEQILMNPEMFGRAKEIGMFGRPESTGGSSAIDLQIEQLRGDRELQIKHLDLEWKKSMLEIEAQDRRTDTIMAALGPLSNILAGPVASRMEQLGQQQAAGHQTPPPVPQQPLGAPPGGTAVLLRCPCGYEGSIGFPGAPPPKINCPICGTELRVGGPPSEPTA